MTTDQITPGRIAYDAYCAERQWKAFNGDALPPYTQLQTDPSKQSIVDGWEKAAKAVLLHGFGVLSSKDEDLPDVAGPARLPSKVLEHRARILLRNEEEKPLPDNALIDFLCNTVRLIRAIRASSAYPDWLFKKGDRVRHRKGGEYTITHAEGDNVFIESSGESAYVYTDKDGRSWVRSACEMEDGRFALVAEVPQGFKI